MRRKYRRDRRPGLPVEKRLTFYRRYAVDFAAKYTQAAWVAWCLNRLRRQIERDPRRRDYSDLSLSSAADDEAVELDLFTSTKAARAEVSRLRRNTAGRRRPPRSDSQAQAKDRVPAKG